jgi:hypothetical protein
MEKALQIKACPRWGGNKPLKKAYFKGLGRFPLITAAVLFCVSMMFPIIGSLIQISQAPSWFGIWDVGLAFTMMGSLIWVYVLYHRLITLPIFQITYRVFLGVFYVVLALLVVYMTMGDKVRWAGGLPGLVWRTYALFYFLPSWIAGWKGSRN